MAVFAHYVKLYPSGAVTRFPDRKFMKIEIGVASGEKIGIEVHSYPTSRLKVFRFILDVIDIEGGLLETNKRPDTFYWVIVVQDFVPGNDIFLLQKLKESTNIQDTRIEVVFGYLDYGMFVPIDLLK